MPNGNDISRKEDILSQIYQDNASFKRNGINWIMVQRAMLFTFSSLGILSSLTLRSKYVLWLENNFSLSLSRTLSLSSLSQAIFNISFAFPYSLPPIFSFSNALFTWYHFYILFGFLYLNLFFIQFVYPRQLTFVISF